MFFFFALLPLMGKGSYLEIFPNLLASLAYVHNAIYQAGSIINNNAWSLEVEIQFYLLVPLLMGALFWKPFTRRSVMVIGVIIFSLHGLWLPVGFPKSILQFFPYFALGILFCEVRATTWANSGKTRLGDLPGLVAWPMFLWVNLLGSRLMADLANPWIIAMVFYSALYGVFHSRILGWSWIPIIGGMCYSIYLLHARILSLLLHYGFGKFALTGNFTADFLILLVGCLPPVILLSGIFYWLIEKPCMNPNWPSALRAKLGIW